MKAYKVTYRLGNKILDYVFSGKNEREVFDNMRKKYPAAKIITIIEL